MSALTATKDAWLSLALPKAVLTKLKFTGDPDHAIDSSFKLGTAAQASISLSGLSAAHFHFLRTGIEQDVTVDARHAVIQFRLSALSFDEMKLRCLGELDSEAWYTVDRQIPGSIIWDPIAGLYEAKGNGFVRLHTNFPHHRAGILKILKIPDSPTLIRDDVSRTLLNWNAVAFETEAASQDMCATALRSFHEWDKHPHAKALLGTPPVALIRIGNAPKRQTGAEAVLPLDGIRVLDLSRVLAGPIAGRALAAQGADVLLITSPNLPSLPLLDIETSLGKRTTQLDLTQAADREQLATLTRDSDVFLQAYRPGGLNEKGFGPQELAALRPGIVCANLTAWGWDGPWKNRRGFDSLVQTATGFNVAEGEAYQEFIGQKGEIKPRPLPMQALDHAAAYFLAFGINAALCRTITEGGSWEVRVSLAGVGQWIRSLGRLSPMEGFGGGKPFPPRLHPLHAEIADLSISWREANGGPREMTAVKQAAVLSKTPAKEGPSSEAPMSLNAHRPTWDEEGPCDPL